MGTKGLIAMPKMSRDEVQKLIDEINRDTEASLARSKKMEQEIEANKARRRPQNTLQKIIDDVNAESAASQARTKKMVQEIEAKGGTVPPSVVQYLADNPVPGMLSNEEERFLVQLGKEDGRLLRRIQEVARMPETFGMRQFHKLIEKELDYGEARCTERFFALCDLYLQYRTRQPYAHMDEPLAPDHWSGVGPITYDAPASRGSVVDAVFARLGA